MHVSDDTKPTATPADQLSPMQRTLQVDMAILKTCLDQEQSDEDDVDVAELLRQLDAVEGAAKGVEDRLDTILGSLDALLGTLEPGEEVIVTEEVRVSQEDGIVSREEVSSVVVRERLEPAAAKSGERVAEK